MVNVYCFNGLYAEGSGFLCAAESIDPLLDTENPSRVIGAHNQQERPIARLIQYKLLKKYG